MTQSATRAHLSGIEQTARLFIELIGLLDPLPIAPLLHEQFVLRTMFRSTGLPLRERINRGEFLSFLVAARDIFPARCPHRIVGSIARGNHVVVESDCEALFEDGRRYANQFSFHILFEGDLIVEVREYTDFLHTKQTVFAPGAMPVPER